MGRRPFQKRIMQDPLSHSMSFMEETGSRSAMGFTKEPFTHVHGVTLCESSYCIKIVYICSICIPGKYNAILITCWVLYSFVCSGSSAVKHVHLRLYIFLNHPNILKPRSRPHWGFLGFAIQVSISMRSNPQLESHSG